MSQLSLGAGAGDTTNRSRSDRAEILRAGTRCCGAGDTVMAASLVILLYLLSSGYLVFWLGLWIVHIMAIIYG